jgi:putative transposase
MNFLRQIVHCVCQAVKQRLRQWTQPDNHTLALNTALDLTRSKSELMRENVLLRQQLIVLHRQTKCPKLIWRDRSLIVLLASKLRTWKEALIIVQPDTVLRWHRELFRRIWRRKSKPQPKQGLPPLTNDRVALIKQMVKENLTWGAERIRGALLKLGIRVSKSPIQKYVEDERKSRTSKQTLVTFLRNHASEIWACDFLQTYDILFRTVFVFVVIDLGSRRVVHFGVTRNPTDQWTAQQLREATPYGEGPRFLIRDNDDKFGPSFARVARGTGIEVLKTPYRAPRANATCERFLGSLRRECLDRFLILSERHLYGMVRLDLDSQRSATSDAGITSLSLRSSVLSVSPGPVPQRPQTRYPVLPRFHLRAT